jgi:hypothetical protein
VRLSAARAYLTLCALGVSGSLLLSLSAIACSRRPQPSPQDPATLLRSIAPADPAKYSAGAHSKHWENPYLIIRPGEVALLTAITANEEQILKPEEVVSALARLPVSAWPYGRAVAILLEEKPATSESDKTSIRRNRGIVEGALQEVGVPIVWMPES